MEQLKFATKKFDVIKKNIYNTIKSTTGATDSSGMGTLDSTHKPNQSSNVNSNSGNNNKKPKIKNTPSVQPNSNKQQLSYDNQQSILSSFYTDDYQINNRMSYQQQQPSNEYIYSSNNINNNFEDLDDTPSISNSNSNINNNHGIEDYENYQFVVKVKKPSQNVNNNNNQQNKNSPKRKEKNNPYSYNEFTKNNNLPNSNNYDILQLNNNNNNINNNQQNFNNNNRNTPKLIHEDISKNDEFYEENLNDIEEEDLDEIDAEFQDFVQIKENNINPICVQYYIPFHQTPEMCKNETRKWLEDRWFLPANMNNNNLIKWSKQNRFYFPIYVFSVSTTTLFNATFSINDVSNTVSNQKISSNYDEIIFCASNSIDSGLVDQLIQDNSYSNRSTHKLPMNDELIHYNSNKNLGEKTLTIDIDKDDIWQNFVYPFILKEETKKCIKYIKKNYYVKSLDLQMRDPIIESERYFIVYLPISTETYQYADSYYDTLTSGNKGKTVGQRPIGTGVIGGTIIDVVSKVSSLVNDSIGM